LIAVPTLVLWLLDLRRGRHAGPPILGTRRIRRFKGTTASIVACVVYLASLAAMPFILFSIVDGRGSREVLAKLHLPELASLGIVLFLTLAVPYIPARLAYSIIRWRTVRIREGVCWRCGYDLTKNESGRCPECGVEIERVEQKEAESSAAPPGRNV